MQLIQSSGLSLGLVAGLLLVSPAAIMAQPSVPEGNGPSVLSTSGRLTEANVLAMMEKLTQAEKQKDVATLVSILAPYAISEVTVESQGKKLTQAVEGRQAHQELLQKTYANRTREETLNERLKVRITPDGQLAIVTRDSLETFSTQGGQNLIGLSRDTIYFAWLDNQPKVIAVKTEGWLEERP